MNTYDDGNNKIPRIWDRNNRIVTPLFSRINQNIKFAALIGCNSAYWQEIWPKMHPHTKLILDPFWLVLPSEHFLSEILKKVDWTPSEADSNTDSMIDDTHEQIEITVRRTRPKGFETQPYLPSVRVDSFDGTVQFVTPPMNLFEKDQEFHFKANINNQRLTQKLNFQVIDPWEATEQYPQIDYTGTMGEFSFSATYKGQPITWKALDPESSLIEGLRRYSFILQKSKAF
jgi:hypothetical protein